MVVTFSSVLKQLREERQLSQKDIAEYLGITRQAVASYELAKREPDYEVLRKLADYFGVSVDYLLGRSSCREVDALTVGKNIDLIRGTLSYREMSEDISNKTGALIYHEMLELYAKGERMPFVGTLKILSKYACVREGFFYVHNNSIKSLERERELYRQEMEISDSGENLEQVSKVLDFMDKELMNWVTNKENEQYIKLAKEIKEVGLAPEALRPLIYSIKAHKLD